MGESMRCPFCGWIGATRTESVCEYLAARPGDPAGRALASQTDRFECEVCRQVWDEEVYRRAVDRPTPVAVADRPGSR
jgi:rubredoxin